MKRTLYIYYFLSSLVLISACDDDENLNEMGQISDGDIPTVTLSNVPASFTTVEEDQTLEIPVTLSEPWIMDSEVLIEMTSGTATLGEDIEVSSVKIQNGDTEGTIVVEIHEDDVPEDTETATFKIKAGPNIKLASEPEFTITIENYVSPDLNIHVSWAADFFEEDPTDIADFDVYVMDADGNDVAGSETGNFEDFDFDGTLPDGDYIVYAYLYGAEDLGDYGPVELPLTTVFNRAGSFSGMTVTQAPDDIITTDDVEEVVYLAIITKQDGIYTIKTYSEDPIVIGSGRKASEIKPNKVWKKK
jgi:hypothetical protein